MEASEVLKNAWSAVQDAGLPDEIRPLAFREAVRLLAPASCTGGKGRPGSATGKLGGGGDEGSLGGDDLNSGNGGVAVGEEQIYDRVVAQTGVERDKLERIVHLDDDGLRLSLAGLKLGRNNAERARTVAQVLTITRGFGLEENETSLELIRTECTRLKIYDSANFSSHISKLSGYVVNGSGTNRRVRAKGPGIQAFPALVDSLLSES